MINAPDEPIVKTMSLAKSAEFLDHQSRAWTQIKKCGTCHTNFPYLMVRGQLGGDLTALQEVRGFFEKRGLDVTIARPYPTGVDALNALQAGETSIIQVGVPMIGAVLRGMDIVALGNFSGSATKAGSDATMAVTACEGSGIVKGDLKSLKGKKIANQVGSSIGNIFVDQVCPANGLKKGDYQEVRMDVNNMIAAMSAKTVDAMINVEPYNAIAEAEGLGTIITDLEKYDNVPVFMAATPEFIQKSPETVIAYLKAWIDVAKEMKQNPKKASDTMYSFFTSKGYTMAPETFNKALGRVVVDLGFPKDLEPYLQKHAEVLLAEKKIAAMPDWKKALRPDFLEKARAGS